MRKKPSFPYVITILVAALLLWMGLTITQAWRSPEHASTGTTVAPLCPNWRSTPVKVPGIDGAKTIAFQDSRLVALNGDGRVWSYYVEGAAACETRAVSLDPARFASKDGGVHGGMARLANSADYATGLTTDGTLVSWNPGAGSEACAAGLSGGACGAFIRRNVTGLSDVADSSSHLLLATKDGRVISAGMNDCGQLGRVEPNSPPAVASLGEVPGLRSIIAIASGKRSSLALDKDGKVWAWGSLSHPLVGSSTPNRPTLAAIYCDTWKNPFGLSEVADARPAVVTGLPPIAAISSFHGFDLALDRQGKVWGWGFNDCGQLGGNPAELVHTGGYQIAPAQIKGLPPIDAIAAGRRHALFLGRDGSVWATGDNEFAQLAMLGGFPSNASTCVSSTERGGVSGYSAEPLQIKGIPRAIAIAADEGHSAAIDTDGHVWIWGRYP
jgi:hypothetical protein